MSQSRQPLIFHENPVSQSNEISLRFWEVFDVVDFQTLYLRAQMEFEGVLWCKLRLFYLTKMLGLTGESCEHLEIRQIKKSLFLRFARI